MQASRLTINKLAGEAAENHWETKGMKHALQAERDYNEVTSHKLQRLKVSWRGRTIVWNVSVLYSFLMVSNFNAAFNHFREFFVRWLGYVHILCSLSRVRKV